MLRDAHAAHDPAPLSIAELSGAVRRWIEGQTFSPRLGAAGVMLLDASAAPYADVDEIRIVGLCEADWPERSTRSIFYPQSLLAQLGWPGEQDRLAGRARALPGSPAAAAPARLAVDVHARGRLDRVAVAAARGRRRRRAAGRTAGDRARRVQRRTRASSSHEALAIDPVAPARRCAARRRSGWRSASSRRFDEPRFRGQTGAARRRRPTRSAGWSATSSARSSTTPRTSSSCPRSATNRRG